MMRIAAGIAAAALSVAALAGGPVIKIERGEACVAPTAEMRRDHMKMLVHQRDRTMRQGLRETRFSLKNCVDCHASRETGSVLGKDGFCSSCHEYAAVRIDCFECHTPVRVR
jgi:hypothetical protein